MRPSRDSLCLILQALILPFLILKIHSRQPRSNYGNCHRSLQTPKVECPHEHHPSVELLVAWC